MASNISAIKQRIASIESTQKITKAMKLVSLSKLQRYRKDMLEFDAYYQAVSKVSKNFLPFDEVGSDLPKLYLMFMPDLGLCSAYTQGMIRTIQALVKEGDIVMSFGTQGYDVMKKKGVPIINEVCSSEHISLTETVKELNRYLDTHRLIAIVPEYGGSIELEFNQHELHTKIKEARNEVIYDPSFELTSMMLVKQALNSLVRYSFLVSKVSEHTTRRIAMEKATDSAQEMIDDLQLKYNKARQEAITQEIAEIVSGMEVQ